MLQLNDIYNDFHNRLIDVNNNPIPIQNQPNIFFDKTDYEVMEHDKEDIIPSYQDDLNSNNEIELSDSYLNISTHVISNDINSNYEISGQSLDNQNIFINCPNVSLLIFKFNR